MAKQTRKNFKTFKIFKTFQTFLFPGLLYKRSDFDSVWSNIKEEKIFSGI